MAEVETGSKLSLAESGAPLGTTDDLEYGSGGGTALGRRRSLAEAAWDAPWRPDLELGDDADSPRHLAALSDPWDSTSPAMKRDWQAALEDRRIEHTARPMEAAAATGAAARPYPEPRRLRAATGDEEEEDGAQNGAQDGAYPYRHLPLRSASEMSAAQRAAAAAVAAAASAGRPPPPPPPPSAAVDDRLYASHSTSSVDLSAAPPYDPRSHRY